MYKRVGNLLYTVLCKGQAVSLELLQPVRLPAAAFTHVTVRVKTTTHTKKEMNVVFSYKSEVEIQTLFPFRNVFLYTYFYRVKFIMTGSFQSCCLNVCSGITAHMEAYPYAERNLSNC